MPPHISKCPQSRGWVISQIIEATLGTGDRALLGQWAEVRWWKRSACSHKIQDVVTKLKVWVTGKLLQKWQEQNPHILFTHPEYSPFCPQQGLRLSLLWALFPIPAPQQSIKTISTWFTLPFKARGGVPSRDSRA